MKTLLMSYILSLLCLPSIEMPITVEKNGMTVNIERAEDTMRITMKAPTSGWVAIGFNESEELTGTYLLMGAIKNEVVILEEHTVIRPGNYKSFRELIVRRSIEQAEGLEKDGYTTITFDIPVKSPTELGKDLGAGRTYHLLMAFSREDDFQHHSVMRTSLPIRL